MGRRDLTACPSANPSGARTSHYCQIAKRRPFVGLGCGQGGDVPVDVANGRALLITGQYIIGTQEYGRIYLRKGMSLALRKRAFLKTLDGLCQCATLSLS